MQSIYAVRSNHIPKLDSGSAEKIIQKQFDQTISLFIYLVWFITEVARYAETDARQRGSKHLPSKKDLDVAVKIAGNELLWRILESDLYKEGVKLYRPERIDSKEWTRKIYQNLAESDEYALYNTQMVRDKKQEREILEFIFNSLMLADEDFTDFVEDGYNNWDDDADMLRLLLIHFLQKPGVFKLSEMVGKEKFKFGLDLLLTTEEKLDQLQELINPKLRNWDSERLAQLDLILLQMGVAEFLYFETIPPKVTINEYIDLAKEYSTPQSGQFVNGILDSVRKELESQERLHKVNYRK
jgi:N utilization substance protein B